uniref:Uncharacterized protein n=1 Tax=Leptospirillum ferrodiazotrophum TaxID=412449 RepID=C6HYS5_9BACT|nr:MAG: hypothetical protein UBAL3_94240156 [Leptospirillum ferrodiazotrophum]
MLSFATTTLQDQGFGVVYFFVPTSLPSGLLLDYQTHVDLKSSVESQVKAIKEAQSLLLRSIQGFEAMEKVSGKMGDHVQDVRGNAESLKKSVVRFIV